jgi:hypothetical protein
MRAGDRKDNMKQLQLMVILMAAIVMAGCDEKASLPLERERIVMEPPLPRPPLESGEPDLESRDSYRVMWDSQNYKIQRKATKFERNVQIFGRGLYDGKWVDEFAVRKSLFGTLKEASGEIDWLIAKRLSDIQSDLRRKQEVIDSRWVDVTPLIELRDKGFIELK